MTRLLKDLRTGDQFPQTRVIPARTNCMDLEENVTLLQNMKNRLLRIALECVILLVFQHITELLIDNEQIMALHLSDPVWVIAKVFVVRTQELCSTAMDLILHSDIADE